MDSTVLIGLGLVAILVLCVVPFLPSKPKRNYGASPVPVKRPNLPRVEHHSASCPEVRDAPERVRKIYNILHLAPGLTTDELVKRLPASVFPTTDENKNQQILAKQFLYYARRGKYFRIDKSAGVGKAHYYYNLND